MRPIFVFLVLVAVYINFAEACEPNEKHHGCMIYGATCSCNYGCKSEYVYRTRRDCLSALRAKQNNNSRQNKSNSRSESEPKPKSKQRNSNACYSLPCIRGNCIQTVQGPGYTCKCEGTGFYGQRCEKACPTVLMRGMVFPHECIVI